MSGVRVEIAALQAADTSGGSATSTAQADATAGRDYILPIPIDLALVTGDMDIVTDWIIGHKFEIVGKPTFIVTEALVGSSKTVDLVLDKGATPMTGGSVTVASASAALGTCVPAAAALSAGNTGAATDVISVRSANTTAFTSGKGVLMLRIRSVA